MIGRRLLLVFALASGLLAGGIYAMGTQRASVVVAAHDLDALRPLVADDLMTRAFPSDAVPEGALHRVDLAIGRVPRAPLQRGQVLLARGVADHPAAFASGLVPPPGTRAIAVPAGPAQAIGGAIAPGVRVDVIAVPVAGRAPTSRVTELVAVGALVLDVRGEAGASLSAGAPARPGVVGKERIGSIVVAIPAAVGLRIADRTATSTFVFVLAASE